MAHGRPVGGEALSCIALWCEISNLGGYDGGGFCSAGLKSSLRVEALGVHVEGGKHLGGSGQ